MFTPERLLRVMIELIFVLLGGLLAWLGLRGQSSIRILEHTTGWLVLSIVLILWGVRALYQPAKRLARGENWTRALSFALLGILMLAITRVPFAWVEPMLVAGGAILALRGIVASMLILRPR